MCCPFCLLQVNNMNNTQNIIQTYSLYTHFCPMYLHLNSKFLTVLSNYGSETHRVYKYRKEIAEILPEISVIYLVQSAYQDNPTYQKRTQSSILEFIDSNCRILWFTAPLGVSVHIAPVSPLNLSDGLAYSSDSHLRKGNSRFLKPTTVLWAIPRRKLKSRASLLNVIAAAVGRPCWCCRLRRSWQTSRCSF